MASTEKRSQAGLLLVWPILTQMKNIEGWLGEDEADLLIAAATRVITKLPKSHAVVEVGSYCGRATFVLASVAKALRPETKIYAIDPHDGKVGALDQGIQTMPPSLEKLKTNLAAAGLTDSVVIFPAHSWKVTWDKPIGLLFIDALHDYVNVSRDFYHFEPWLAPEAYIAFHDYADYYPGVKTFVNEILGTGQYEKVHCASSMMVMRKLSESAPALPKKTGKSAK